MTRSPVFALVCVVACFLLMPAGHSLTRLLHVIEDPWLWAGANIAVGMAGFALVWVGLKRPEVQACVLGFLGANLMFTGFFEFTFALFGDVFQLAPVVDPQTGRTLLSPGLQINEASFFIMLPLFLLFYANPQVRCNMIVWIRRQLRMDAGKPTEPSAGRPYARIVASETLFIIWMIYAISLAAMDPRLLGPTHWFSMLVYTGFMIWPLYLTWRIVKIRVPGAIVRYAIPVGILYWTWVETFASMDLINEYYLHPLEYPVASLLTAAAGLAGLAYMYGRGGRAAA